MATTSGLYAHEVRHNLSYFPSWQPGEDVSPGDVGELDHGVFHRQGTLQDLFPDIQIAVRRDAKPSQMTFQSQNAVSFAVRGGAGMRDLALGPADASAEITFSRSGAVVLHARDCSRRFIDNLGDVRERIVRNREAWPKSYALVSHVEEARRFAVLVSGGNAASVTLVGKLSPLQQYELADASVSVASANNIAYQRTGTGPVLLRLYGLGWFRGLRTLSGVDRRPTERDVEFDELSPRDPSFD